MQNETHELHERTAHVDLELDGTIYLVQRDKEGKLLVRDPMDGEVMLKVLLSVVSDGLDTVGPPELTE